jgi:multicomponent Na+:H+ antiporter subunit C
MAQVVLATFVGVMFACGTYLMLQRNMIKLIIGTIMFSQASNVYLITMGAFEGGAPVLSHGGNHSTASAAGFAGSTDPLVQAMVLTAIVIGFGTTAFALVLTYRVYEEYETVDLEKIRGEIGD